MKLVTYSSSNAPVGWNWVFKVLNTETVLDRVHWFLGTAQPVWLHGFSRPAHGPPSPWATQLMHTAKVWFRVTDRHKHPHADCKVEKTLVINSATFASICTDADQQLFTSQHLLHPLLRPEREQHYSLRDRSHNYRLPDRTSTLNGNKFIIRMLYNYWLLTNSYCHSKQRFDCCLLKCYEWKIHATDIQVLKRNLTCDHLGHGPPCTGLGQNDLQTDISTHIPGVKCIKLWWLDTRDWHTNPKTKSLFSSASATEPATTKTCRHFNEH